MLPASLPLAQYLDNAYSQPLGEQLLTCTNKGVALLICSDKVALGNVGTKQISLHFCLFFYCCALTWRAACRHCEALQGQS